uniref:Cadherin domain-containing protein n=1 Tax=Glossina morsitans morsitans TaxID=37546 RepID=A0A1B0FQL5_GLOMM
MRKGTVSSTTRKIVVLNKHYSSKELVYYYIVDSPRNEGKEFFEINLQSGEIFTKTVFDREKKGAYALEVEARDGAPSARPNSNGQPNSELKQRE